MQLHPKKSGRLSILDTADKQCTRWCVAYMDRENPRFWNKFLKPGYQHVQLWGPVQIGDRPDDVIWINVDPGLEFIRTSINFDPTPPWHRDDVLHTQIVTSLPRDGKVREWFMFGPLTCVEVVKAYLGISSRRVITPWQLHEYIRRRDYLLR